MASDRSHTMADVGEASTSGPGGTQKSKEADIDPWRKLSAVDLRANTVVFPARKQTKLPEYVRALEEAGFDAADILSIQVSTMGQCRVTLSQASIASSLTSNGFRMGEETILPKYFSANSNDNFLQLHIHDVPVWVSDCVIAGALAQYGTVHGNMRHGKFRVRDGVFVASGVRFATFKPKSGVTSIPSSVRSGDGKHSFRVYHNGQLPTCHRCGSPNHIAAKCPSKPMRANTVDRYDVTATATCPSSSSGHSQLGQPFSYASAVQQSGAVISAPSDIQQPTSGTMGTGGAACDVDLDPSCVVADSLEVASVIAEARRAVDDKSAPKKNSAPQALNPDDSSQHDQSDVASDTNDENSSMESDQTDDEGSHGCCESSLVLHQVQANTTNDVTVDPLDAGSVTPIDGKIELPTTDGPLADGVWQTPGKRKAMRPVPSPDSGTRGEDRRKKKRKKRKNNGSQVTSPRET